MKTSDLIGPALDYLVAKCEGETLSQASLAFQIKEHGCLQRPHLGSWKPSTSWAQGGVILEREGIDLYCNVVAQPHKTDPSWRVGSWRARICSMSRNGEMFYAPTPLIAAMRVFVASRLGDEVDVPEELAALVKGE